MEKRSKMPISERAKIFMPFEPLKGFREALAEREERARQELNEVSVAPIPPEVDTAHNLFET